MITALVLLIILSIILVIVSSVACFFGYRATIGFLAMQDQHEEYHRFLNHSANEIEDSSAIFRLELAKKLSLSIPETKELNSHLHQLETKMNSMKMMLREFLSEE